MESSIHMVGSNHDRLCVPTERKIDQDVGDAGGRVEDNLVFFSLSKTVRVPQMLVLENNDTSGNEDDDQYHDKNGDKYDNKVDHKVDDKVDDNDDKDGD